MSKTRTEQEIIAEAYSDEAAKTWRAPVQRYPDTIPWPIHLEAYAAYVKRWSKQTALIDLKGRHCRGGFGIEELDELVPGWRDRVSYIGRLEARIAELEALLKRKQEPFPQPRRKDGGEPCGECHIQPGETCDICGASCPPPSMGEGSNG